MGAVGNPTAAADAPTTEWLLVMEVLARGLNCEETGGL